MHLTTFKTGACERLGALIGKRILDLQAAHIALVERTGGSPCEGASRRLAEAQIPNDAQSFIALGAVALEYARQATEAACANRLPGATSYGEQLWHQRDQIALLPPVTRPGKVIAIGLNYKDHAAETNLALPANPVLFAKFTTCLVGDSQPIAHPGEDVTTKLDYEVELAVVIGKGGRRISEESAMQHVFGYSVMNDVSARDLQFEDGQWLKGKALDGFAPFGPSIATADEIPDPHALNLSLTLNGLVMQQSNTRHMIFSIPRIISYISKLITLEPGDVISTGTPPGVGFSRKPPVYLRPGDTMTAYVEGVGTLTNMLVTAQE